MKADSRFLGQSRSFWANVRLLSQEIGYTVRGEGRILVPTLEQIVTALTNLGLNSAHFRQKNKEPTELGRVLLAYFAHRADVLDNFVEPRLMDAGRAKEVFEDFRASFEPSCPLPMNKQKKEKRAPAYLTGLINMIVEAYSGSSACNYDPRQLTTVTRNGLPVRTLSRRVDGAFPAVTNPISVWEIKEYYYTTTFGSRVADGVYETLLDGMELDELREHEGIHVQHYLMIDSHFTWWKCGRSYLCRIMDMLHMGYLTEVLFGYEVVERLPQIVESWTEVLRKRS